MLKAEAEDSHAHSANLHAHVGSRGQCTQIALPTHQHFERNTGLVTRFLLPELGDLPVSEVTEDMALAPILKAYNAGTRESARRAAVIARQVVAYAKAKKWVERNALADILNDPDLAKPPVSPFKALKSAEVGPFLQALKASETEPVTRAAMMLMLYTGLRDFSLRAAQWNEIDLDAATWTVPGSRMKSRRDHVVPLPTQGVEILRALAKLTKRGPESFVFKSRAKAGYLAENTLRKSLHDCGFKVTAHGFRSMLTDLLNVNGFNPDAIERQLDHAHQDKVRGTYLRADFMPQRRAMMQWVADWIDSQRNEAAAPAIPDNVVAIRRAA